MQNGFTKKIELFANVAIVVVAIVLTFVLVKKFVLTDSATTKIPKENISIGGKINLSDADWAGNGQTLMLVLSTDCRYCHESLPFYQKLSERVARNGKAKMIAVFPQSAAAAEEYLKSNGVTVSRVYQANPPSLGVGGTPSLLLVDRDGRVMRTWFGKLVADEETKVLEQL